MKEILPLPTVILPALSTGEIDIGIPWERFVANELLVPPWMRGHYVTIVSFKIGDEELIHGNPVLVESFHKFRFKKQAHLKKRVQLVLQNHTPCSIEAVFALKGKAYE